ncbi:MAG: Gfo/Idh/MocA family oxidoreductase [Clostridiaceae bacterium]|nr:Gfo/Idh/MocA family oxidoreductase [Clostridiaceae bacterium]
MKKIRLGVIGTGLAWERLHYPALNELSDKYEIKALANRTKADAELFADKIGLPRENVHEDYRDMLKRNDIDAVDILVPIEQNYTVSADVAEAGFDFICEKPMAPDMEQAKKFLELAGNNKQLNIMIAENYRYSEEYNKIKQLVDEKRTGDVIYFIKNNVTCFPCGMSQDTYAGTEWRQHPRYPGGAFLDAALHDIAGMRYILGEIECVQAFGKPQERDFNPYISINANILFKNGVIGQFNYYPSGMEAIKPMVGFRIFGTKGQIFLEDKTSGVITAGYNDGSTETITFTPERGYYNELLNFYNAVNGTESILVTPEVEYGDVKTVFQILDSVKYRRITYVDTDDKSAGDMVGDILASLESEIDRMYSSGMTQDNQRLH